MSLLCIQFWLITMLLLVNGLQNILILECLRASRLGSGQHHWRRSLPPWLRHLARRRPASSYIHQSGYPNLVSEKRYMVRFYSNVSKMLAVWPDWAIYWTLGYFLKPLPTINLSKSPTFLGNFCKGVKIFHFSIEIILGNFCRLLAIFFWSHWLLGSLKHNKLVWLISLASWSLKITLELRIRSYFLFWGSPKSLCKLLGTLRRA